ncbi:MAG: SDR family NAD(P)-dependent oxidoreductase [Clostridia bacterium]|nr:SDR family NAD(P)-dependent oxidoreductase [Clostridia bacterium]
MKNWLQNEYVVLSGASSGIGRELCKLLIEKYGANVIGIGRKEEKMQTLKTELGENAERFTYSLFDVGEKTAWQNFAQDLKNKGIQPILLIHNAGMFPSFQTVRDMPSSTFERIMNVNYFSIVYGTEALFPFLKRTENTKPGIVNVASSAALCTVVGTSAYSASKAAIKGYTEALQMEEKGKTYVGLICPGTTATELFDGDANTKNSALDLIAMPAAKMAKKIARKIYKKCKRAVLGWDAKCMNWVAKIAPVKGLFLIRWVMKISHSKVFSNVFKDERSKK